jgi:hypothetical protein
VREECKGVRKYREEASVCVRDSLSMSSEELIEKVFFIEGLTQTVYP